MHYILDTKFVVNRYYTYTLYTMYYIFWGSLGGLTEWVYVKFISKCDKTVFSIICGVRWYSN